MIEGQIVAIIFGIAPDQALQATAGLFPASFIAAGNDQPVLNTEFSSWRTARKNAAHDCGGVRVAAGPGQNSSRGQCLAFNRERVDEVLKFAGGLVFWMAFFQSNQDALRLGWSARGQCGLPDQRENLRISWRNEQGLVQRQTRKIRPALAFPKTSAGQKLICGVRLQPGGSKKQRARNT